MEQLPFDLLHAEYRNFRDAWYGLALHAASPAGEVHDDPPPGDRGGCAERFLQIFWNEQRFAAPLRTVAGVPVEVGYPGAWNVAAGPDFKGARLLLGGQPVVGDVEIHRRARDWYAHQHHQDPEYAGVALHVIWDAEDRGGPDLPTLALRPQLAPAWQELVKQWEAGYPYGNRIHPGGCALGLAEREDTELRGLLRQAGAARFGERVDRFLRRGTADGFDQALYAGVFEALGYKMNREPMARLTTALPLAEVRPVTGNVAREALFLGSAGLLPDPTRTGGGAEWRAQLRQWWDCWWHLGRDRVPGLEWKRAQQRPCNRPERRLRAGVAWLDACQCQPVPWLLAAQAGAADGPHLRAHLEQAFHQAMATGRGGGVGLPRIRDLLANVALPLLAALGRQRGDGALTERAFGAYAALPRLQENRPLTEAAHRLFVPPSRLRDVTRSAVEQQGLLQLHQDFCRAFLGQCENCPFQQSAHLKEAFPAIH